MSVKCWICGTEYTDECPECGPPQPLGPVQADYDRVAAEVAADDKREEREPIEDTDEDYAREVCVPRRGPI